MENQESMWYAPSGDTPQASPPVLVPPAKPKKRIPAWGIALILVAVAVLIIGSCLLFRNSAAADPNRPGAAGDLPNDYKSFFDNYFTANEEAEECTIPTVQTTERVTVKLSPAGKTPLSAQEVYERCVPSIVAVSAFPDETSEDSYYWGSGVVLTEDGYILTNSHVVEGTCRARITLWDDTEYDALLVGYDHRTDIAVLKIDAHGLTPAEFTSTDSLLVGDAVYAIGNPLGKEFRSTMTEGIISGINRDISHNGVTNSLLQTSAPINEGNSGGALVNVYGQVVGVTNMKMSSQYIGSVSIEGVAFAIRDSFEVAKSLGIEIPRSNICGGGAKSPLWRKIFANVLGIPLDMVKTEQGPGYGAAMLAMVGCGKFKTVQEAADKLVETASTTEPDAALTAKYEARYQSFKKLYPALKEFFAVTV